MSGPAFHGLTWDHPRGYRALDVAAAADPARLIAWSRQPLEGFESHPIAELAARHDLLVLDHPHLGEAVAEGCLLPLDDLFGVVELAALKERTLGHTYGSYRWGGRLYALPLDIAAQVMARDPAAVPEASDTWDAVARLAERVPVALSLAGPHAVLSFYSLCLSLGETPDADDLVGDAVGIAALRRLAALAARVPAGSDRLNPTGLLEAIGRGDGIALAPLVFGALYWRERSGVGQEVKVDLLSAMLAHQGQEMLMAMNFGADFVRPNSGIGHLGMDAPFGVYPTADGWVTIAMSPFARLVGVLGDESLLAFDDPATLFDRRDEVWEAIAALTKAWTTADLMAAMLAVDIWCGEVKTHLEAADDPQVRHMGMITSYEHPSAGTVKVVAPAVRLSATPAAVERLAPLVGEHTEEILADAGYGRAEIDAFLAQGAVARP